MDQQHDGPTTRWTNNTMDDQLLHITSLGGSASAFIPNYADYLVSEFNVSAVINNPSTGYTSSLWGSQFMDHFLTGDEDVLIWEMAINDWMPRGSWTNLTMMHQVYFDLYIQRAPHVAGPRIRIIALSFWQPNAAGCWPNCGGEDQMWDDLKPVIAHYQEGGIDIVGANYNQIAKSHFNGNSSELFRDAHHPTTEGFIDIAETLLPYLPDLEEARSRRDTIPRGSDRQIPSSFALKVWNGSDASFMNAHFSGACGVWVDWLKENPLHGETATVVRANLSQSQRLDYEVAVWDIPKCIGDEYLEWRIKCDARFVGISTVRGVNISEFRIWTKSDVAHQFEQRPIPEFMTGFLKEIKYMWEVSPSLSSGETIRICLDGEPSWRKKLYGYMTVPP